MLFTVMLNGKRSTQKEIDGVCTIQVLYRLGASVSSIYVILDDLNTSTGWGLYDLHEIHVHVNRACICRAVINWWIPLRGWVRVIRMICTIYRQALYNVDVPLMFWRWDLIGLYDCACVPDGMIWTPCMYVCMMWRISMNDPKDQLPTHSN